MQKRPERLDTPNRWNGAMSVAHDRDGRESASQDSVTDMGGATTPSLAYYSRSGLWSSCPDALKRIESWSVYSLHSGSVWSAVVTRSVFLAGEGKLLVIPFSGPSTWAVDGCSR